MIHDLSAKESPLAYGKLCSIFYDATKAYAPHAEVDFYASFIEQYSGIGQYPGRVLEAMSGSGRLQIPLIQRGYVVDGVDNSSIMLDRCRVRCADLGIVPELFEQSLEQLDLSYRYATVTIAVGSFQLIANKATALQVLKNIHAHMQVGGNLLIDFFVPDRTQEPRSTHLVRIDEHRTIRLNRRHVFDESEQRVLVFCNYELMVDGLVQQREDELIEMVWYNDDEFRQLFADAGFAVVDMYTKTFRPTGPSHIVHVRRTE